MENLSVEQLQEAHRPFRKQTIPEIRANLKRLGYDWRGGLPREEIGTYARRFVYERHQEGFLDAIGGVLALEPKAPRKKAPRKKKAAAK